MKADLFRYYFLYMFGGVYLDDDIEAEVKRKSPIESIWTNRSFVSVKSHKPGHSTAANIFNGIIAAAPRHLILRGALRSLYHATRKELRDFHFGCDVLYKSYKTYTAHAQHDAGGVILLWEDLRFFYAGVVPTCLGDETVAWHHWRNKNKTWCNGGEPLYQTTLHRSKYLRSRAHVIPCV